MSERLRTGTAAVARGDRGVLRRTDIRSETDGQKRKSTASRLKVSERNSGILTAQIHHLIRKLFFISRKI